METILKPYPESEQVLIRLSVHCTIYRKLNGIDVSCKANIGLYDVGIYWIPFKL